MVQGQLCWLMSRRTHCAVAAAHHTAAAANHITRAVTRRRMRRYRRAIRATWAVVRLIAYAELNIDFKRRPEAVPLVLSANEESLPA